MGKCNMLIPAPNVKYPNPLAILTCLLNRAGDLAETICNSPLTSSFAATQTSTFEFSLDILPSLPYLMPMDGRASSTILSYAGKRVMKRNEGLSSGVDLVLYIKSYYCEKRVLNSLIHSLILSRAHTPSSGQAIASTAALVSIYKEHRGNLTRAQRNALEAVIGRNYTTFLSEGNTPKGTAEGREREETSAASGRSRLSSLFECKGQTILQIRKWERLTNGAKLDTIMQVAPSDVAPFISKLVSLDRQYNQEDESKAGDDVVPRGGPLETFFVDSDSFLHLLCDDTALALVDTIVADHPLLLNRYQPLFVAKAQRAPKVFTLSCLMRRLTTHQREGTPYPISLVTSILFDDPCHQEALYCVESINEVEIILNLIKAEGNTEKTEVRLSTLGTVIQRLIMIDVQEKGVMGSGQYGACSPENKLRLLIFLFDFPRHLVFTQLAQSITSMMMAQSVGGAKLCEEDQLTLRVMADEFMRSINM
eukprot:Tbor_TRINITY_DN4515_c0_g1::TRINITY_DN4515_c0_g1_i1::g.15921::m.15921